MAIMVNAGKQKIGNNCEKEKPAESYPLPAIVWVMEFDRSEP